MGRKIIIIVTAGLLVGAGLLFAKSVDRKSVVTTNVVLQSKVKDLPKRSPSPPTLQLADTLIPPTNKWFSALALASDNQPVYAYPLSFAPTNTGFTVGVPLVVSSSNAVFGSHNPAIAVNLGVSSRQVAAYDDLSVLVNQSDTSGVVSSTRITHGSPYTFTTFKASKNITITPNGQITKIDKRTYQVKAGEQLYGIYIPDVAVTMTDKTVSFQVISGQILSIFAIGKDADASDYYEAAKHPVIGTSISYTGTTDETTTTYTLKTVTGTTLFADLPSMRLSGGTGIRGTFQTILGQQNSFKGNDFTSTIDTKAVPSGSLALSRLTMDQRNRIIASLKTDSDNLNFKLVDSYFGGKEVYRAANLLQLAKDLKQTIIADSIQSKLKTQLNLWLESDGKVTRDNRYFYYDTSFKGIVAEQASYGSELFNDHHFHYGYFIYAASVLAKYDSSFMQQNRAMVETLISDIASPSTTKDFPKLRVFDPYVGHSWASGNGDFTDGNNQESTSEAINAWYAINLWSKVTKNNALQAQSIWLYQNEAHSAQQDWLNSPKVIAQGPKYAHAYAGIVWGGKVDYSTFFSARPHAILGIQLIPMSPGQSYLAADPESIKRNLIETVPTSMSYKGQFNDYIVMYQSLVDQKGAVENLQNISAQNLDNGNSMSYLKAYIFSQLQNTSKNN